MYLLGLSNIYILQQVAALPAYSPIKLIGSEENLDKESYILYKSDKAIYKETINTF